MKKNHIFVAIFVVVLAITAGGLQAQNVPESDFSRGLQWAGVACSDTNYTLWGASPVIADDGKVHLFVARWPETNVDPAWRKSSEIAHYVADHPEGPFSFSDVSITGTGIDGDWDKYAPCNPEIQRFGDLYVLLYIANSDYHQPPHPENQFVGMATASSPYGPWIKVGTDGMILEPSTDPSHFSYGERMVNPTLLKVGNLYHLYFKTIDGGTIFGVATSSSPTGPYTLEDAPITTPGVVIEDACSFIQNGKVHFLTTDNHGSVTGIAGGGALWLSDDGLSFDPADTTLGFRTIPSYYEDYDAGNVTKVYGNTPKFERPKVLMLNDRPRYMYAPSGWNVTGGDRTVVHVLRVDEPVPPPPENPNPNIIQNGDFETGTGILDANWGDTPNATKLPSWSWGSDIVIAKNAGNGTLGYGNGSSNLVSPSSDQQLGFNSNVSSTPDAANSSLWQTFGTVSGVEYEITFSMGAIFFTGNTMSITASVYDGTTTTGTSLSTLVESRASGKGYNAPVTFIFTATSTQSTLLFVETSENTSSCNPAIDNVSVRETFIIPPPTPPSLMIENPRSMPENGFGFDWRLSHGRGVDIYRSSNLTDSFEIIAADEWIETFSDPVPPSSSAFYRAVTTGGTLP